MLLPRPPSLECVLGKPERNHFFLLRIHPHSNLTSLLFYIQTPARTFPLSFTEIEMYLTQD
jgi:hypothetical protein